MEVNNLQTDGSADLESNGKNAAGRWTSEEHSLFILGLQIHNKQWKNIADMVKTRTVVQIRTHAQKYFQKLEKTNPSGSAAFNNKAMTDGGVFPESNSCDADDSRMANYRAQSICSTDSADSSKYGRSVSLGSDAGTESDYLDRTAGGLASGAVPHCSSFPTDMLINSYMTSGLVDLKPRSSTMTDLQQQQQQQPKASSAPKKRSRDSAKVNGGIGTAQTPKSPKRNHHKQMAQQHQQQHHHHTHGPYGIPHSASECDELDMISLLEKIDWNAIPSPHRSHASSPFTDTAASLSSSSGHVSYKNVLNKCQQASSPLQFSHIDQVNVNEELTDNDVFDVFDEYYKNIDTTAAPVPTLKLPLEIKKEAKPAASATAAAPANPALMDAKLQPRVWFSSSVIGELKTNFSIGNGILKPWKDRKPVTKLPPLHSLTSSTPPVVIASQSLTPLDSTFCNYPPQLYQTDETADGFKGYASDATATTSGGSSSSSSGFSIKVPESPCGYDSLSSPKTYASYDSVTRGQVVVPLADFTAPPAQSPVVKKRGRPRKSSLTNGSAAASASSVAVKSRSCNNLSAAAQPGFPMSSYPSFPNIGTTGSYPAPNVRESRSRKNSVSAAAAAAAAAPIAPPLSGPMHHFDDFLMGNDGDMASSFAHQLSHEHDAAFASLNQTAPHALYANPFHGDDAAEDVQMQLDCSLSFGFDEHELQAEAAGNAAAAAAAAAASGAVGADSSMAVVKQEEDLFDVFDAVFE